MSLHRMYMMITKKDSIFLLRCYNAWSSPWIPRVRNYSCLLKIYAQNVQIIDKTRQKILFVVDEVPSHIRLDVSGTSTRIISSVRHETSFELKSPPWTEQLSSGVKAVKWWSDYSSAQLCSALSPVTGTPPPPPTPTTTSCRDTSSTNESRATPRSGRSTWRSGESKCRRRTK